VDSSDLPLNVSREMLQSNRVVFQINKNIAKKVLDKLNELKKNEFEKYEKFYNEFGNILKEGIYVDFEKKEEIAKLLIFNSLKHLDKKIDFFTYVENMKEDQKEIFYMTGSSINEMINSPHLEYFKEKDIDVIFLTDEIDEIVMSALMEFNLKKVKSILKGDIEVDEETKKRQSENEREHKTLLAKIKEELKDYVKDVKAGARLKNSLCCLVYDENEMDDTTRRLFEAMGQTVPESKMILELNLEHPVVRKLNELYKIDPKSPKISEYAKIIYDLALVEEGKKPIDSPSFAKKVAELLEKDI
jgi:molecular chaperone HtpG